MPAIFVDADACPVKEEIYRVAQRYKLAVTLVANAPMRVPQADWLKLEVVPGRFDAADDWIAEHVTDKDIVITSDIPLASRCLQKGALVIDSRGGSFTDTRIGDSLATREIMSHLRNIGEVTGGPAPFDKRHRSQFLQKLDQAIQAALKKK